VKYPRIPKWFIGGRDKLDRIIKQTDAVAEIKVISLNFLYGEILLVRF
jgi:hypothetical protein